MLGTSGHVGSLSFPAPLGTSATNHLQSRKVISYNRIKGLGFRGLGFRGLGFKVQDASCRGVGDCNITQITSMMEGGIPNPL